MIEYMSKKVSHNRACFPLLLGIWVIFIFRLIYFPNCVSMFYFQKTKTVFFSLVSNFLFRLEKITTFHKMTLYFLSWPLKWSVEIRPCLVLAQCSVHLCFVLHGRQMLQSNPAILTKNSLSVQDCLFYQLCVECHSQNTKLFCFLISSLLW